MKQDLQSEEAKVKLEESEKELREKLENLEKYINIVFPEIVCYREHLKAVKDIVKNNPKVKCLISYAWNPDKKLNSELQAQLKKLKVSFLFTVYLLLSVDINI